MTKFMDSSFSSRPNSKEFRDNYDRTFGKSKSVDTEIPECTVCTPVFDEEDAKTLSSYEIRAKYPRFDGVCPICSYNGIKYASKKHYYYGDW